jgi:hypothetical protein
MTADEILGMFQEGTMITAKSGKVEHVDGVDFVKMKTQNVNGNPTYFASFDQLSNLFETRIRFDDFVLKLQKTKNIPAVRKISNKTQIGISFTSFNIGVDGNDIVDAVKKF